MAKVILVILFYGGKSKVLFFGYIFILYQVFFDKQFV